MGDGQTHANQKNREKNLVEENEYHHGAETLRGKMN